MTQRQLAYKAKLIIFRCCAQDTAKLTGSEIARQLGVSQANLSRAVSTYSYIPLRRHLELKKFWSFDVLVSMYKIFSVNEALEILDIESASHFIKRYKDHRGYTPGLFCKKERRDWAEKKRKNDRDYLHWCEYKEFYQVKR